MLPVIDIPGLGHREIDPGTPLGRAMQLYSAQRTASQRFWAKADIPWPRDGLGMVFLGSAVHLVGDALFGNQWTGDEPCVGPFGLPKYPFAVKVIAARSSGSARLYASASDRRRAMTILGCRRDGAAFPSNDDTTIDMEDWELAQRIVEEVTELLRPVRQRWAAVIKAIGDGIVAEKFQVKLLPQGSSGFGAIRPATDWFVGSYASRFSFCQIDPSNPNSADPGGKSNQWIFLTDLSLRAQMASLSGASPSDAAGRGERNENTAHEPIEHPGSPQPGTHPVRAQNARHSPKRAALDRAVKTLWAEGLPSDIEIGPAVNKVLAYFEAQPKDRAQPQAEYIRKHLNELRGLSRP